MLDHFFAVIMAGGGGTRLWPLSRKARPKQMLSLFDERSLFQTSVQRLNGIFTPDKIYIVTVADQAAALKSQCPEIPDENYLIEPMPRGTASVVGLAALALQRRDPQAVMAVLASDHYIGNEALFHQLLIAGYDAAQDGYLVTLGIEPDFPATGFGYIQRGDRIAAYNNHDVYRVLAFKEKPDEMQARQMLSSGNYTWNSGMFFWRIEDIMAEIKRQMPKLAAALEEIRQAQSSGNQAEVFQRVWSGLETETIDYGVMEGARNVVVIPAFGLEWSDIGTWDSLFRVLKGDPDGNIVVGGAHVGLDTSHTLIYVDQQRRLIVTIGVDDLVLVDTGDVLLVCRKDQAQKVRQVVHELRQRGMDYT